MINGVNTLDFAFAKDSKTKKSISNALPQARSELITVFQYAYTKPEITMSAKNLTKVKEIKINNDKMEPPANLERVHVQRLQTHTQLRNNKWTFQNFYSNATTTATTTTSAATTMDNIINATHNNNNKSQYIQQNNNNDNTSNNNNNKNIFENKSALNKCNKEEQLRQQQQQLEQPQQQQTVSVITTPFIYNRIDEQPSKRSLSFSDNVMMITSDKITNVGDDDNNRIVRPNYYRTEDQENAFRQIEDVHNYAKLKHYGHSNESSDGSIREFDDDDDEEEEDDDVEEDDIDDVNGIKNNVINVPTQMVHNFHKQMTKNLINTVKYRNSGRNIGGGNGGSDVGDGSNSYLMPKTMLVKNFIRTPSKSSSTEDTDAIVDVETVAGESEQQLMMNSPPAHHARRPMNAFLIFCKRHRAIVKDRYKSLENRAITKILGDWWASLDGDEKECFTKLAQQNKDAFFSAHPNFKWYKLPAPPLRTLSTRPSNAERNFEDNEHEIDEMPRTLNPNQTSSFFKLADETQMGELNSLINIRNKNECPLQKALGETTHFLSAHMPNVDDIEIAGKKRAITENSFSSNSSEDDVLPKKTSRSCKGKIYQELVSSGQIAPIAKKSRTTKLTNIAAQYSNTNQNELQDGCFTAMDLNATAEGFNAATYLRAMDIKSNNNNKTKRTFSESDVVQHFGEQFDLEEKIKQLPALSLDAYLQRKRNTKKKKKFTTRKRTSNSVSLPITDHRPIALVTQPKEIRAIIQQHQQQQQQAVGSQKRKARKESITRRDVSAVESEVASILPTMSIQNFELPKNGCYFYNNEKPTTTATKLMQNLQTTESIPATTTTTNDANYSNDLSRNYNNYADSITTTSDLFILAEVAAKRTELTN